MLQITRTAQLRKGQRSSDIRERSYIRDGVRNSKISKIKWDKQVIRLNNNQWTIAVTDWIVPYVKYTLTKPRSQWLMFFTNTLEEALDSDYTVIETKWKPTAAPMPSNFLELLCRCYSLRQQDKNRPFEVSSVPLWLKDKFFYVTTDHTKNKYMGTSTWTFNHMGIYTH